LIKILLVHQLKLKNDNWDAFLIQNDFITPIPIEVDKLMMEEITIPATNRAVLSPK